MNRLSCNCIPSHKRICDRKFTQVWPYGAIAVLFVVALSACTMVNSDSSNSGTTISKINNQANANFIGKTVTVNGEVEEVISPKAFIIEGDRFFNDPELLVLNLSGSPIVDDSNIQVTGTVRQFLKSEIEREFGLNLAQELAAKFTNKRVLVATELTLTPEPGEVAEEPDPFMGKNVTISGKVENVIAPNLFTLDDKELIGGKELLVVGNTGAINVGQTVRVIGSIRKLVTADLDIKRQPRLIAEYEGKAAAIARSIEIVK